MPIYEYACIGCDHTLDALQKIADAPLVYCPSCGEPSLKRLLSAPSFRLKGKGWYETDFKTDNQRNIAGEKDAASAESTKTESTQSDSKTATDKAKPDTPKPASSDSKKSTA